MTPEDVMGLIAETDAGSATCARDLPLPVREASALLRKCWRDGRLVRILPGVYGTIDETTPPEDLIVRDHEAASAYGRLHRRMMLPAPDEAARMIGLSDGPATPCGFVWNGPERTFGGGSRLRIERMPGWSAARTGDPAVPFLLALSSDGCPWKSHDLDALAGRIGADLSRTIDGTRRSGLPKDLALCLARFRKAVGRVHGPKTPTEDIGGCVADIAHRLSPKRPFDRCRPTSARIVAKLASRGIRADILRCRGWRGHATPDEDRRWNAIPADRRVHYVVHVAGIDMVVDATWRQFDPSADPVRIGSLASTTSEWMTVEMIDGH